MQCYSLTSSDIDVLVQGMAYFNLPYVALIVLFMFVFYLTRVK